MSLPHALCRANEDEHIEITRECWDCRWQETRRICVESIATTAGDESAIKRAALIDEIADELVAVERVATLEDALAEVRRQRRLEPSTDDTDEDTPK